MFDPQTQAKLEAAWTTALAALVQTSITWEQSKPPQQTATAMAHVKWAGNDDLEVVNAYGHGTVTIVVPANALPHIPEKLDVIRCALGTFTVQAAHKVIVSNAVSFWRLYAKGR